MARARPGEFELIERYFRPLATDPGAFRLGDDAARLRPRSGEELVLTTDLIAAGVHFLPGDPPASVARKGLRVNLSDLAAKGATPAGYLLALALPVDWTEAWVRAFAVGLAGDQERYGVSLLGGDTTRAAGGLTVSVTAIGRLPRGKMVHRSGARPDDLVYVSGTIGDAALGLGLHLARSGRGQGARHLIDRYLHPQPRVALAKALRDFASASLDVSDGLVGDFGHVCEESGTGGEIDAAAVPLSPAAAAILRAKPEALPTVLTGGDDYEILATVPAARAAAWESAARRARVPVTRIGRVTAGKGPPRVLDASGREMRLDRRSWDHFRAG